MADKAWKKNRGPLDFFLWIVAGFLCCYIHPPKTNMTMENHHFFNRRYMEIIIFKWLVFHCHVSFPGCSRPSQR